METSACERRQTGCARGQSGEHAAHSERIAAALLSWLFEVAERRHGIERAQLLEIAALDEARLSDPNAPLPAVAQLEQRLVARERPASRADVVAQVQGRLRAKLASDSALPSVASELGLSARTLQRQLAECGTSFRQLLEEARCTRALDYLRATDQAVDQIAVHVGYPDPANFRRAFRRWTGASPSAFRGKQAASGGRSVPLTTVHQGSTSPF